MVITYFGKSYFKLVLGDLTIAINPPNKDQKPARFGADIVLISNSHNDYNGISTVSLGDKEPFIIDTPGSYEKKELLFSGTLSKSFIDNKEYINTVYAFELDNIKIVLLGAISDDKLMSPESKEAASTADLLFVSVGEDPARSYKIATSFEPNVIIPTNYNKDSLTQFLKEAGQDKGKIEEKLTIKRKDLDGKQGFVIPLLDQS